MKKRTMNELRQTKEYYVPKERVKRNVPRYPKSYGHDQIIEQNKEEPRNKASANKENPPITT